MAQPYVGEIRMFAGNFAPTGWMFCNGQQLPISENETLFQLIGTTYGGDGQSSFALPDLRGRVPLHRATFAAIGETSGVEEVTLTVNQIPFHTHALVASTSLGNEKGLAGNVLANSQAVTPYLYDAPVVPMSPAAVGPLGGSQPHSNLQPYVCINFIISLFGIFPSET